MTVKRKADLPANVETVTNLKAAFDKMADRVRALLARQDDIVRSLGSMEKLLQGGFDDAALALLQETMARDLKQARERTADRDAALRMAVEQLQIIPDTEYGAENFGITLEKIKILAPEAFGPPAVEMSRTLS